MLLQPEKEPWKTVAGFQKIYLRSLRTPGQFLSPRLAGGSVGLGSCGWTFLSSVEQQFKHGSLSLQAVVLQERPHFTKPHARTAALLGAAETTAFITSSPNSQFRQDSCFSSLSPELQLHQSPLGGTLPCCREAERVSDSVPSHRYCRPQLPPCQARLWISLGRSPPSSPEGCLLF